MATEIRQIVRHQPPDWFTEIYAQSTNAERQRSASHQVCPLSFHCLTLLQLIFVIRILLYTLS
jgi:hypothetical protein